MSKPMLITPLTEEQQDCVAILEEALSEARAGMFSTVAVVMCKKEGFASAMAGRQAADLNLGLDDLKAQILKAIHWPQATAANIMRTRIS